MTIQHETHNKPKQLFTSSLRATRAIQDSLSWARSFASRSPLEAGRSKISTEHKAQAHIPARLIKSKLETHNTKTYYFQALGPFNGFKAGAHINVELELEGQSHTRSYTLSSNPKQQDFFSITVKKVAEGLVSRALFDGLEVGNEVRVSQPLGHFVLPYQPAGRLLFLTAGSGITPAMSMLRYLTQTGNRSQISFLHYAQSPEDLIFGTELEEIAKAHKNVQLSLIVEKNAKPHTALKGRIRLEHLYHLVPDLLRNEIYLCGPPLFMQAAKGILEAEQFNPNQLHQENFTADLNALKTEGASASVSFTKSRVEVQTASSDTLLEAAEAQGLKPLSACRMGICQTCRCKKTAGTTINLLTGKESSQGEEYILPCITVAKTDTLIEL